MTDTITLRGTVGTDPRLVTTANGTNITSFRLASPQRRFDRDTSAWIDGDTNWYTISAYRQLARNTGNSIKKGDPVIVTGRLKVRPWEAGDKKGVSIEVDAESLGHDLLWGTTTYTRALRAVDVSSGGTPVENPPENEPDNGGSHDHGDSAAFDATDANAPAGANSDATETAVPTPF